MLAVYSYQNQIVAHLSMNEGNLNDNMINGLAYGIELKRSLDDLDRLNFRVPMYIYVDGVEELNWRVDYLNNETKIRLSYQNYDEYFLIKNIEELHDNNGLFYNVECVHFSEILNKKGINKYVELTGTALELVTEVVSGSGWEVGTVDVFENNSIEKIRHYEKDNSSTMEMLYDLQEIFEGFLIFDSINKQVSFKNNVGSNNGVVFRYKKNIENISRKFNTDSIVTRLYLTGGSVNDNIITIANINPTGAMYIDDFSYFENLLTEQQVISIKQYNTNITNINSNISGTLLSIHNTTNNKNIDKNSLETKIIVNSSKQQLKNETDLKIVIEKDLTELSNLQALSSSLGNEISVLNSEISALNNNISGYDITLSNLNNNLNTYKEQKINIENSFADSFKDYIREGHYKHNSYIDSQALYDDAVGILSKNSKPKVEYNINIVDLSVLTGYELEKFDLGDIVGVIDEKLRIGIESPEPVRIREVVKNISDPRKNSVVISTFRGKFDDEYNRIVKSAEVVKNQKDYYERALIGLDANGRPKFDILQATFDNNKFTVVNGTNNTVTFNDYGVTAKDNIDSNKFTRMNSGGIFVTEDGGLSYEVGLSSKGISATMITSGVLNTKVLQIWNSEQPKFFWDEKGLFSFGDNDDQWLRLNYKGLYGTTKTGVIKTSINESDFNLILNWDKLQITRSDNKVRNIFSVTDGIKIQAGDGSGTVWTDKFYADSNGVLNAEELVTNKLKIKNGADTLIDADTLTIDFSKFTTKLGQITTANIENLIVGTNVTMGANATISWSNVTNQPSIPVLPSYINSTYIGATTIYSPSIVGGSITSNTTINVGTDAIIGNNLYIGNTSETVPTSKSILFNSKNGVNCGVHQLSGDGSLDLDSFASIFITTPTDDTSHFIQLISGKVMLPENTYCGGSGSDYLVARMTDLQNVVLRFA